MHQPIPNPPPRIQAPESLLSFKPFRQTAVNHQLTLTVVVDRDARVEVTHNHDFSSSLDEAIYTRLQQSLVVHLEFTALFSASAIIGTIHADEDEQPEVNDNGASFTV